MEFSLLKLVLYESSSDILKAPFSLSKQNEGLLVIGPNPQFSDAVRSLAVQINPDLNIESITISQFMKRLTKKIFKDDEVSKVQRKSDLILELGLVWRKIYGAQKEHLFFQAFKVFTELRSYSIDLGLIEEVLDMYPEELSNAIRLFWNYLDTRNLMDEQASYYRITEEIRFQAEMESRPLMFWGFSRLSGGQVDLINSLAQQVDVFLPIPTLVYEESRDYEWPKWVEPNEIIKLENEPDGEPGKVVNFGKGKLNKSLHNFLQEKKQGHHFVLATKSPDFYQIAEIPIEDRFFRIDSGIFEKKLILFKKEVRKQVSLEKIKTWRELFDWNLEEIKGKQNDLILLRVRLLFKNVLETAFELTSDLDTISLYDTSLILSILELNLPRTFNQPITKEIKNKIVSISDLPFPLENDQYILCAKGDYDPLKGGEDNYSEELIEFLLSVGPMSGKNIDFLFLKFKMTEFLANKKNVLFLEEGLEEKDLGWSEVLTHLKLDTLENPQPRRELKVSPLIAPSNSKLPPHFLFSPSSLQTYVDCKRKFYLEKVLKLKSNTFTHLESIRGMDKGTLEHDLVRLFFQEERDLAELDSFVTNYFNDYVHSKGLALNDSIYLRDLLEIKFRVSNGVTFLLEIQQLPNFSHFAFEEELSVERIRGRADVVIYFNDSVSIVDFKRSKSSIPTKKAVEEFKKVQIPLYTHMLDTKLPMGVMGYFNLGEPETSLLIARTPESQWNLQSVKAKVGFFKDSLGTQAYWENQIKVILDEAFEEVDFFPSPVSKMACQYCDFEIVCHKGASDE